MVKKNSNNSGIIEYVRNNTEFSVGKEDILGPESFLSILYIKIRSRLKLR